VSEGNGRDRDRDTDSEGTAPAPKDPEARLAHQLAELELAVFRVGEVLDKVNHTVSLLRLSQGTSEHRLNKVQDAAEVQAEQLEDHERRLRELETAPSPAAAE